MHEHSVEFPGFIRIKRSESELLTVNLNNVLHITFTDLDDPVPNATLHFVNGSTLDLMGDEARELATLLGRSTISF